MATEQELREQYELNQKKLGLTQGQIEEGLRLGQAKVGLSQQQLEQSYRLAQQQIQQQEQRATQLNKTPSEPLPPQTNPPTPTNDTCFPIQQIHWNQSDIDPPRYLRYQAQAAIIDEYARPQCMNQTQLAALQKSLNNSLIEHGHITSKVSSRISGIIGFFTQGI